MGGDSDSFRDIVILPSLVVSLLIYYHIQLALVQDISPLARRLAAEIMMTISIVDHYRRDLRMILMAFGILCGGSRSCISNGTRVARQRLRFPPLPRLPLSLL